MDLQVVREDGVAGEIGDDAEARGRDHHRDDGKAVEAVRQVHRIAGATMTKAPNSTKKMPRG
jgi:hypothetical protein